MQESLTIFFFLLIGQLLSIMMALYREKSGVMDLIWRGPSKYRCLSTLVSLVLLAYLSETKNGGVGASLSLLGFPVGYAGFVGLGYLADDLIVILDKRMQKFKYRLQGGNNG